MLFLLIFTLAIFSPEGNIRYWWDFETGWQGWSHINGLMFPEAWDIQPSDYYPAWTPPDAGDSCMWIDSDAIGMGTWVQDTVLSPAVAFWPAHLWSIKYGMGYRNLSSDWLEVGIKYFDGSAWTVVPLIVYALPWGPAWDSANVSAYNTYDSLQIYFYYDDQYHWGWYTAFDNVMINGDTTGIIEETKDDITLKFGFAPDMPTLTKHPAISYTTTTSGEVSLKVYDSSGRLIRTFVNNSEPAGTKTVYWDGKDVAHRTVPNGVYFVGLKTEEKEAIRKIVLIRQGE